MSASKRLRLDRSRSYGTAHGERPPGDKHQLVQFTQDGIHFDAHGLHIDDLIEDDKTRALVDRRLKRQAGPREDEDDAGGSAGTGIDPSPTGGGSPASTDVNLEAWLRGEEKYQWFAITKAVRDRYSQNISKQFDMVTFLVYDEKVIPEDQLSPDLAELLKKPQA